MLMPAKLVAFSPAPKVYAPAENNKRCHGTSTSFHFTTPTPGNKATIAPINAMAVLLTPWYLSVAQKNNTNTNMMIDFISLKVIEPSFSYSFFSMIIPPSIEGFCSSFLRGKIIFVPTTQPIIISNKAKGKAAIDQSVYKKSFIPIAPAIMAPAKRLAPEPVINAPAAILI